MCMDALSECMYVPHMHVSYSWSLEEGISLKRALDIVDRELQMVVSHGMGAEYWTWVYWKSSHFS